MREAINAPSEKERSQAYAAGRLAAQTGKDRDDNPHVCSPAERTTRSDWLRTAWDAGYDFETC